MCLLQLGPVVQYVESEANDPIPEEEGIFVLVSLTTRPRSRGGEALESLHGRAGLSGCAGSIREPLDVEGAGLPPCRLAPSKSNMIERV
jgi:hypothetical protein